jgi:serine/threonine-protein kinase ULK/ATG1
MKSRSSFYIVLEYCNAGDLGSLMRFHERLGEDEAREVISQLVEGMSHLHSLGIIHRDLKLNNILLNFPRFQNKPHSPPSSFSPQSSGEEPPAWLEKPGLLKNEIFQIKIADLGFSKIMDRVETDLNSTYCGTPINMSPEVLNREVYGYKSDIWSVGTILFELIAGRSPFKEAQNKDHLKKKQKEAVRFPSEVAFSEDCKKFILACMHVDPQARPSWEELRKHKFLQAASIQKKEHEAALFQSVEHSSAAPL